MAAAQRNPKSAQVNRSGLIAAIQITWKQLRPDIANDKDALRDARLEFIADVLELKKIPKSMTAISDRHLLIVLDAMRAEQVGRGGSQLLVSPAAIAGTNAVPFVNAKADVAGSAGPAEVIPFANATQEQKYTIEHVLIPFLGWTDKYASEWLQKRFKVDAPSRLNAAKANSAMMILLNSAASKDLKEQGVEKPGRDGCAAYIPTLKKKLGIND